MQLSVNALCSFSSTTEEMETKITTLYVAVDDINMYDQLSLR